MDIRAPRPGERTNPRRVELAVVAGLSVVGLVAAFLLLRRPPSEEHGPIFVGQPPQPDRTLSPRPKADPVAELDFTRLMEILGGEGEAPAVAPVAKAFAREFMAQPELKAVYDDYKGRAGRGEKPKAKDFLASLRPLPAFQKLAADVGRGAAGSAAYMTIARNPEIKPFLAQQDRSLAAAGRPDRRASGAARRLVASGQGSHPRGGVSAFGPGSSRGPFAATDAARGPGGTAATEAASAPGTQGPGGQAGPGAHAATPLDKTWKDQKTIAKSLDGQKIEKLLRQYPCLAPLGEATLQRFISGSDIDSVGLWGACFQLHLYETCRGTGCSAPLSCWQSCLDSNGDAERTCIQKVRTQPGCGPADVPAAIWEANCVPKRDLKGRCLTPNIPIPECGLPPCADETAAGASKAAVCAALANRPLAQAPDPRYETQAEIEWNDSPEVRAQFELGIFKNGRTQTTLRAGEAYQRFLLEYTRDRRTRGWRDCSVGEGGYITGDVGQ